MKKPSTALVVASEGGALYVKMQTAIAACHSIDDCREAAVQAQAIAAYYKQIKDDASVVKFIQIKIRAWRRIGELLVAGVNREGCYGSTSRGNPLGPDEFNLTAYVRKIKEVKGGGDPVVAELSDDMIRKALRLAELPSDFFEDNLDSSIDGLLGRYSAKQREEWEATPEGRAVVSERARRQREYDKQASARAAEAKAFQAKLQKEAAEKAAQEAEERSEFKEFKTIQAEAFDEVGITLQRRDRKQMKQIVFLIEEKTHKILRQAAFDNEITMQAILRAGLMMWLMAHGYVRPPEEHGALPLGGRLSDEQKKRARRAGRPIDPLQRNPREAR